MVYFTIYCATLSTTISAAINLYIYEYGIGFVDVRSSGAFTGCVGAIPMCPTIESPILVAIGIISIFCWCYNCHRVRHHRCCIRHHHCCVCLHRCCIRRRRCWANYYYYCDGCHHHYRSYCHRYSTNCCFPRCSAIYCFRCYFYYASSRHDDGFPHRYLRYFGLQVVHSSFPLCASLYT